MNFDLTEEQRLIQETARDFAAAELDPAAAALDRGEDGQIFMTNLGKLAELGFMGLNIDDAYGGSEAGAIAFSLAMTEIARACASTAVTVSVNNMVGEVIQALGNEDQKEKYISRICSGEYPAGAFALTEPGAGSDPAAMTTVAVRDGGEWVLNGGKIFITSGSFAGIFVVWAVTDQAAAKGKGISLFLVEAGTRPHNRQKRGENGPARLPDQRSAVPGLPDSGRCFDGQGKRRLPGGGDGTGRRPDRHRLAGPRHRPGGNGPGHPLFPGAFAVWQKNQ
jgi:alkylation response protein AidB-like acyl-CoA dehydrogenase